MGNSYRKLMYHRIFRIYIYIIHLLRESTQKQHDICELDGAHTQSTLCAGINVVCD